jgi:hypothetical protein
VRDRRDYLRRYRLTNRERLRAQERDLVKRRSRFLQEVKTTCGCIDCGTREGQLDFDHRSEEIKTFTIGRGRTRNFKSIIEEILKCDVRCASCHTRRHWATDKRQNREQFVADLQEAST